MRIMLIITLSFLTSFSSANEDSDWKNATREDLQKNIKSGTWNSAIGRMQNMYGYTFRDYDDPSAFFEDAYACPWFFKAAMNGNKIGLYNLANCYSRIDPIKYFNQAEFLYKKVLEKDSSYADALNSFGLLYITNNKRDEALGYLKKAAEQNDFHAYINLGVHYQYELENPKKAQEYYKTALDLGSPSGWFYLAWLLEKTNPNLSEQYFQKAYHVSYHKSETDWGTIGNFLIGRMYLEGKGGEKNDEKALLFLNQAAASTSKDPLNQKFAQNAKKFLQQIPIEAQED